MITSSANSRIKAIRKLRDRKERQVSQTCYIEGLRLVIEAIQLKADIETVIFSPELLTSPIGQEAISQAYRDNYEVVEVSRDVFQSISIKDDPQGIAAIARQKWRGLTSLIVQPGEVWVALVGVSDPGNLGTILRTLDAVGGRGVILLDHFTDPYDPTAIRASMGAIFSLDLVKTGLDEFQNWKVASGIPVVGAADNGAVDYHTWQYPDRMILMMGSERQGLLPQHNQVCDQIVRIPMVGRSDSLNLAVATSVILYEVFNHRRDRRDNP